MNGDTYTILVTLYGAPRVQLQHETDGAQQYVWEVHGTDNVAHFIEEILPPLVRDGISIKDYGPGALEIFFGNTDKDFERWIEITLSE